MVQVPVLPTRLGICLAGIIHCPFCYGCTEYEKPELGGANVPILMLLVHGSAVSF